MDFKNFLQSKRFAIIIYVMICWFIFGVLGILKGSDMGQFAAYFAALSPFVIGYVYGETKRPSNNNNK